MFQSISDCTNIHVEGALLVSFDYFGSETWRTQTRVNNRLLAILLGPRNYVKPSQIRLQPGPHFEVLLKCAYKITIQSRHTPSAHQHHNPGR